MAANGIVFLQKGKTLLYDGESVNTVELKKKNEFFTATTLPLSLLHTYSFKVPNSTSDEELEIQTEIRFYKEGGLDPDKEYIIDSLKLGIENEFLVEAFGVEKGDFQNYVQENFPNTSAIDLAFPRFIAYEALYEEGVLSKESVDLILYFSDDEAFAVLYKAGTYIGHRSIKSIASIAKELGLELVKLREMLLNKGLIQENYTLDEMHYLDTLNDIFAKDIEKIVYSINNKRRFFLFNEVQNIYIDFDNQMLEGLGAFFTVYDYTALPQPLPSTDETIGNELLIPLKYALYVHSNSEVNPLNLTALTRREPLLHYYSVQLALSALVTFFVTVGIYVAVETYIADQESKIADLNTLIKNNQKKFEALTKKFKLLKKESAKLAKEQKALDEEVFVLENTLNVIPLAKEVSYSRQLFMNDIIRALQKYRLNTESIRQLDKLKAEVMLISKSNRRDTIAKFIGEFLSNGYSKAYTTQISYENGIYKSLIRIER